MIHFTISGQSHDLQQMDPDGLDPLCFSGNPELSLCGWQRVGWGGGLSVEPCGLSRITNRVMEEYFPGMATG